MTGFQKHPSVQPRKGVDGVRISRRNANGVATVTERDTGALVGYVSGAEGDWNGYDASKNVIRRHYTGHRRDVVKTLYRVFCDGVNKDPHPHDVRDKLTRWEYRALEQYIAANARRQALIETVHLLEDLIEIAGREMPTNRLSTRDVERSIAEVVVELEKTANTLQLIETKI